MLLGFRRLGKFSFLSAVTLYPLRSRFAGLEPASERRLTLRQKLAGDLTRPPPIGFGFGFSHESL